MISSLHARLLSTSAGLCAILAFNLSDAAAAEVRHEPPACFRADAFPRLEATVEPAGSAARVRVLFRPDVGTDWYAVTALPEGGRFVARLPRPRAQARRVHYRFETTGADAVPTAGTEFAVDVVADPGACAGAVAPSEPSAHVVVDVPPGAPRVPPVPLGFDPVGAVSSAPAGRSGNKKLLVGGIVAGAAAVGGAFVIAKRDADTAGGSVPLTPSLVVLSSTPAIFQTVSISSSSMTVMMGVLMPRPLPPGRARLVFLAAGDRVCATLTVPHGQLLSVLQERIVFATPFESAVACGQSAVVRIVFEDFAGQLRLQSGTADFLDASAPYVFTP